MSTRNLSYSYILRGAEKSSHRRWEESSHRARVDELLSVVNRTFSRHPGSLTTDPRLKGSDLRIWDVIASLEYVYGKCVEPAEVIGALVNLSRKKTEQAINELVKTGWLLREKAVRKTEPDRLTITKQVPESRRVLAGDPQCSKCKVYRDTDAMGVCIPCRKQEVADKEAYGCLVEKGRIEFEIMWLALKANGSKSGQLALKRGYYKAMDRTFPGWRDCA